MYAGVRGYAVTIQRVRLIERGTREKAVTGVVVRRGNKEETIAVKGVFIYLQGDRPITGFLESALPTDTYGCLMVDKNMQTAIPGVFAAGDVLCPEVKQAVAAAQPCKPSATLARAAYARSGR